jgi:hypothetical protein
MPKGGPSKKPADFKRLKHKVGKKAPKAANFTDTSFTSKSINVVDQSISEDKGEAVTRRNLNAQNLLKQLNHFSANMRKEALVGLEELATKHAHALNRQLGVVLEGAIQLLVDDEKDVRAALLSFLRQLMPSVSTVAVAPFLKLMAMYARSGMTSLHRGVRLDAVKLLDVFAQLYPTLLRRHMAELLPNYAALLTPAKNTASNAGRGGVNWNTTKYDLKKTGGKASASSGGQQAGNAASNKQDKPQQQAQAKELHFRVQVLLSLMSLLRRCHSTSSGDGPSGILGSMGDDDVAELIAADSDASVQEVQWGSGGLSVVADASDSDATQSPANFLFLYRPQSNSPLILKENRLLGIRASRAPNDRDRGGSSGTSGSRTSSWQPEQQQQQQLLLRLLDPLMQLWLECSPAEGLYETELSGGGSRGLQSAVEVQQLRAIASCMCVSTEGVDHHADPSGGIPAKGDASRPEAVVLLQTFRQQLEGTVFAEGKFPLKLNDALDLQTRTRTRARKKPKNQQQGSLMTPVSPHAPSGGEQRLLLLCCSLNLSLIRLHLNVRSIASIPLPTRATVAQAAAADMTPASPAAPGSSRGRMRAAACKVVIQQLGHIQGNKASKRRHSRSSRGVSKAAKSPRKSTDNRWSSGGKAKTPAKTPSMNRARTRSMDKADKLEAKKSREEEEEEVVIGEAAAAMALEAEAEARAEIEAETESWPLLEQLGASVKYVEQLLTVPSAAEREKMAARRERRERGDSDEEDGSEDDSVSVESHISMLQQLLLRAAVSTGSGSTPRASAAEAGSGLAGGAAAEVGNVNPSSLVRQLLSSVSHLLGTLEALHTLTTAAVDIDTAAGCVRDSRDVSTLLVVVRAARAMHQRLLGALWHLYNDGYAWGSWGKRECARIFGSLLQSRLKAGDRLRLRTGAGEIGNGDKADEVVDIESVWWKEGLKWVATFPQLLWLMGAQHSSVSEEILQTMVLVVQRLPTPDPEAPPATDVVPLNHDDGKLGTDEVAFFWQKLCRDITPFFATRRVANASSPTKKKKVKTPKGNAAAKARGAQEPEGRGEGKLKSGSKKRRRSTKGQTDIPKDIQTPHKSGPPAPVLALATTPAPPLSGAVCSPTTAASRSTSSTSIVHGPFSSLPSHVQRAALSLLFFLPDLLRRPLLLRGLAICAHVPSPMVGTSIRQQIVSLVACRYEQEAQRGEEQDDDDDDDKQGEYFEALTSYLSFLLTALVLPPSSTPSSPRPQPVTPSRTKGSAAKGGASRGGATKGGASTANRPVLKSLEPIAAAHEASMCIAGAEVSTAVCASIRLLSRSCSHTIASESDSTPVSLVPQLVCMSPLIRSVLQPLQHVFSNGSASTTTAATTSSSGGDSDASPEVGSVTTLAAVVECISSLCFDLRGSSTFALDDSATLARSLSWMGELASTLPPSLVVLLCCASGDALSVDALGCIGSMRDMAASATSAPTAYSDAKGTSAARELQANRAMGAALQLLHACPPLLDALFGLVMSTLAEDTDTGEPTEGEGQGGEERWCRVKCALSAIITLLSIEEHDGTPDDGPAPMLYSQWARGQCLLPHRRQPALDLVKAGSKLVQAQASATANAPSPAAASVCLSVPGQVQQLRQVVVGHWGHLG